MVKILKRVPHTSCDPSSRKLAAILNQVTLNNNESYWERLFRFAPGCLRVTGEVAIAGVWYPTSHGTMAPLEELWRSFMISGQ